MSLQYVYIRFREGGTQVCRINLLYKRIFKMIRRRKTLSYWLSLIFFRYIYRYIYIYIYIYTKYTIWNWNYLVFLLTDFSLKYRLIIERLSQLYDHISRRPHLRNDNLILSDRNHTYQNIAFLMILSKNRLRSITDTIWKEIKIVNFISLFHRWSLWIDCKIWSQRIDK